MAGKLKLVVQNRPKFIISLGPPLKMARSVKVDRLLNSSSTLKHGLLGLLEQPASRFRDKCLNVTGESTMIRLCLLLECNRKSVACFLPSQSLPSATQVNIEQGGF